MRLRSILLAALLLLGGSSGCALFNSLCGSFHQPELKFDRAELLNWSLSGLTVNLHWNLHNDNPVGLELASLSYAFSVENHQVVAGHPQNGFNIAANGVSPLAFPASVNFKDLAQTIEVFLTKDVAHYTASGSIGVKTPVGVITLPLSYSNQFPVPKVPEVRLMNPVINSINIQGAHLTLPLQVHNKNTFPLPFNGLSGGLTLSGANVASSQIGGMNAMAPNEQRVVNLGVDVNFFQSGMSLANAINSRSVDVAYHGNLNVAGVNVPINISQRVNLK